MKTLLKNADNINNHPNYIIIELVLNIFSQAFNARRVRLLLSVYKYDIE